MANPYASHKNDYLRNQVMSASPNKLIEMLIEGAIKSIKKLKFSVNKEIEGDIPQQLISTYDVVEQELIQANIHKDKNHLEIALTMLNELLDAWKQITK